MKGKVILPCMRGRMGDWLYYVTLMSFADVALRVRLPKEIDAKYDKEDLKLGDWIQRKLNDIRTDQIADYLLHQEQRFFNALILGIYDGEPKWQEITLEGSEVAMEIEAREDFSTYLSKTFGILTLSGKESIFAIDGQHRAIAIRKAVDKDASIGSEEQSVIFISHKPTPEGKIRTRRVFSTLNKYAKPVSESEIVALSEDDNSAILTRRFIDTDSFVKGKVLVIKNRPLHSSNDTHVMSIMVLHDIINTLVTNQKVAGNTVKGYDRREFTSKRLPPGVLDKEYKKLEAEIKEVLYAVPSVKAVFEGAKIDRTLHTTNLMFWVIGQNVIFSAYKLLKEHKKGKALIDWLKKDEFNLANPIWRKIFWLEDTREIDNKPTKQKAAILYLVDLLGYKPRLTPSAEKNLRSLGLLK